ncbi:TonB-dependent receptor domain-containing protein [Sphingobacterium siyangense]|uniref:TonB-dependent receptor domain-containing protein n=1 Tax=Sphingobacterium siyangense TaxID=459529 RepID=UPI002FDB15E8
MTKSTLLSILLSGAATGLFAQTKLSGKIFDKDGHPIKGATASLLHLADSSLIMQADAAKDGSFLLHAPKNGSYLIRYSSIGYITVHSRAYQLAGAEHSAPPIFLQPVEHLMETVHVVGKQASVRQYADKMVVDVEGSVLAEGNNVLELLEKTPGLVSDGKGNFSIQGRAGANVRINGRDMYVSGEQLASILRGLQASEVSKLELISNPSAREDAAGTAGIINIVTKRNAKAGFGGDAFIRAGQGRQFYGGLGGGLHYKVNGLDMYLQGNKSYDRSNSHNLTERSFLNQGNLTSFQRQHERKKLDDASFHSVRAGAKYEFSDGGVLDGSVHWMTGNYKPYASIEMDTWDYPANIQTAHAISNNRFDESFKNWTFNINYINKYEGEDHFLKFNFDFAPHGNDYNNRFETDQFNLQTNTQSSTGRTNVQDLSNTTYSGRLDYSKPLTDSSKIELGWKGTYFFINNDVINTLLDNGKWIQDDATSNRFQYTQHIEALYAIYSGKYKRIEYQAGLRGEYTFINANQVTLNKKNDQRYFDLFPSGSLLYHLNEKNTLRTSFSSRIERPGDHDINVFRIYEDAYSYNEGNPDLKPEKSYITEIGHGYRNKLFTTVGISYGRDMINWIIRQGDKVGENLSKPENIGRYMNYSASVMYNQTLRSWWTASHYVNAFYNNYSGEIGNVNLDSKGSSWTANSRHTLQFKYGFRSEIAFYYRSGITTGPSRTDKRYGIDVAAEKKMFGDRGMIKLTANGLLRNANPQLVSEYGDLKVFYADFPDNRKVLLSLSYRFGD